MNGGRTPSEPALAGLSSPVERLREELTALDRAYSPGHHGRWSARRRATLVDECLRELFASADPLAAKITQTYRRPEQAEPEWPLERELPSGELLTSPNSETQQKLAAQRKAQPFGASALKAHQQKPMLNYAPVGCPPLAPVSSLQR